MIIRLAQKQDLNELKEMYKKVVENMHKNGLEIWNEYYPCEVLADDIANQTLYILEENDEILASCVLCPSEGEHEEKMGWKEQTKDALYVHRFAVNTKYLRQGTGSILLEKLREVSKEKGAKYLRLFAITLNENAIKFYTKNGFNKVEGIHPLDGDETSELVEFGFEVEL